MPRPGCFSSTHRCPRAALQELRVPEASHVQLQGWLLQDGSSASPGAALEPGPGKTAHNEVQERWEEAGANGAHSPSPSTPHKPIHHACEATDPAQPRRLPTLPEGFRDEQRAEGRFRGVPQLPPRLLPSWHRSHREPRRDSDQACQPRTSHLSEKKRWWLCQG